QHLDLLVDRDPDVVLAGPVEVTEGHVLEGADGREVTGGELLAVGETQQFLDRLVTRLADQNERPLGPDTHGLRLHSSPPYPPASPASCCSISRTIQSRPHVPQITPGPRRRMTSPSQFGQRPLMSLIRSKVTRAPGHSRARLNRPPGC